MTFYRFQLAECSLPLVRVGIVVALAGVVMIGGCGKKKPASEASQAETTADPSDVPRIVLDMIDAHGGMVQWRSAGTVSFEDEFTTPGGSPEVSRVMVDQRTRRAYIDFPGTDMSLTWDGRKAWGMNWNSPTPPRFIALLNYYFVNLPWLTMDPGVKLEPKGTGQLAADSTEYAVVMMTFEPGTGDTPNDYYRLYIDPATKRLRAFAYVVTYRALLPPGMQSTPEHIVTYDSLATVNGLAVPVAYTIYENDAVYATCAIRNWTFGAPYDEARMTMPEGAVVDTTTP
jgi:hypothetical protein